MPVEIVVDAMGSDKAPETEIRGAILAARTLEHVHVTLAGPEHTLRPALEAALDSTRFSRLLDRSSAPISIVNATEWITMEDKAAQAVRSKRDSSMRVGLKPRPRRLRPGLLHRRQHRRGHGHRQDGPRRPRGVDRPALATVIPNVTDSPTLLLDVGANVDCDPENLIQFAVMGSMYARNVLKRRNPRVGLLSIGEEDSKGNSLTRDTLPMLRTLTGINFIGNVEGRDLFNGAADVVVCDGFVGNVALKTMEGLARLVSVSLRESLKSTVTSQVGALLSRTAFNAFKKRLDYSEYGGAPLLGVRGVCIVGHGSSNEKAVMNGIRVAAEFASAEVNSGIEAALLNR